MPLYDDYKSYQNQAKYDDVRRGGGALAGQGKAQWQDAAAAALGGPIGWYEAATGKKVLSNQIHGLFGDQAAYQEMNDEEVFKSMSPQDWEAFNKMSPGERLSFVTSRRTQIAVGKAPKPGEQEAANKEKQFQEWKMQKMRDLDAFSKQMGMSVQDLIKAGDAGVQAAGANATSQAGAAAYGAGLTGGGVSAMNTQRAVTDAQQRYQMGRQQLGLQATNDLLGQMGQMGRENEDIRRYEQSMNLNLQNAQEQARQRNYAEGMGRQQSMFGLAGGVIGGVYGGPQGAAMGYNIGSGVGGMAYQPYTARAPQYPSGQRPQGLGGGPTYGGSQ